MEGPFCDVIGCSSLADRFYKDGVSPVERLCAFHWDELLRTARDRALRYEHTNPDRLRDDVPEPKPRRATV